MLIDPDTLRAFAGQVDIAALDIGTADVSGKSASAGDALPGSTTPWAVGEHFSPQAQIDFGAVSWTGDDTLGDRAARNLRFTM